MKYGRWFLIFLWGGVLLWSGCLNLKGPEEQIQFFTLEYDAAVFSGKAYLPFVIQVDRFGAAPTYNTRRMIYRDSAFKRDAYVYRQWRDVPGDMVSFFLARDLQQSGLFKAVIPCDSMVAATHRVEGTVEEFLEWDTATQWEAVLGVSITLTRVGEPDASRKVLFQKIYTRKEVCREKNPRAVAAAMSLAMRQISEAVIGDIYTTLKNG